MAIKQQTNCLKQIHRTDEARGRWPLMLGHEWYTSETDDRVNHRDTSKMLGDLSGCVHGLRHLTMCFVHANTCMPSSVAPQMS